MDKLPSYDGLILVVCIFHGRASFVTHFCLVISWYHFHFSLVRREFLPSQGAAAV